MKRKRLKKLLMALGLDRKTAEGCILFCQLTDGPGYNHKEVAEGMMRGAAENVPSYFGYDKVAEDVVLRYDRGEISIGEAVRKIGELVRRTRHTVEIIKLN